MSCLDNIISIRNCHNNQLPSLSGIDIMDAPELSFNALSKISNDKYINGYNMVRNIMKSQLIIFRNDFLSALRMNNLIANVDESLYNSGTFDELREVKQDGEEKGITLYKVAKGVRKVIINSVQVFPLQDYPNAEVIVYDGQYKYTYPTSFISGAVNTIDINHNVNSKNVRIVVPDIYKIAESQLTCFVGCNGTLPNPCAYVKGYDGNGDIGSKKGFGVNIVFQCKCDFDQLLCNMSPGLIGNIFYIKLRMALLNERIYSDRMNEFITYGRDEALTLYNNLGAEYTSLWNTLIASLPSFVKSYNDECINCKGIRVVTNI